MAHATLTLTKSERVIIRTHWEGELLSSHDHDVNGSLSEYDAVVAYIPMHYPDPSGITVDMADEAGNILASYTFPGVDL
jgi:hypothetical protein